MHCSDTCDLDTRLCLSRYQRLKSSVKQFWYLAVLPRVSLLALAEVVGALLGAGALVEARRGEAGVSFQLAEGAVVAGGTDALEASDQGQADPVVQAGHRETVIYREGLQHQVVLGKRLSKI